MSVEVRTADGIAEVVIDFPPVNALPVQGWQDLAAAVTAAGAEPATRAVILAAAGPRLLRRRGHQGDAADRRGTTALLGANQGCFAAFAAVYDCPVPVIAAVHGFCLGGGVGLAGNADIVVAADDATFGLPEVDRGALGAATHLARLVPQPLMRAMVYTCRTVTARQLLAFGTVLEVVPPAEAARRRARAGGGDRGQGPGGDPAGEAVAERHRPGRRQALLPVRAGVHLRAEPGRRRATGRVRRSWTGNEQVAWGSGGLSGSSPGLALTPDEVVAELRDGMTIGIGGWGSRRKPMALVRAIARSPLRNLTIVCYAGPDAGLLVASGQAKRIVTGFASLDSIALEPHFRRARQDGTVELTELDEGMLHWGLLAAAHRLPFLPIRAGPRLRRARGQPGAAHDPLAVRRPVRHRGGTGGHAGPAAGRRAGAHEPGRRRGQRPVPRPRPVLRRPVLPGGRARLRVVRADRAVPRQGRRSPCCSTGPWCTPSRKRRTARTSPAASPTTAATRRSRRTTRGPPPTPAAWQRFTREYLAGDEVRLSAGSSGVHRVSGPRRAQRRSAWWLAPRRGAATARSWPARWG